MGDRMSKVWRRAGVQAVALSVGAFLVYERTLAPSITN
jgi:hypothetical protein